MFGGILACPARWLESSALSSREQLFWILSAYLMPPSTLPSAVWWFYYYILPISSCKRSAEKVIVIDHRRRIARVHPEAAEYEFEKTNGLYAPPPPSPPVIAHHLSFTILFIVRFCRIVLFPPESRNLNDDIFLLSVRYIRECFSHLFCESHEWRIGAFWSLRIAEFLFHSPYFRETRCKRPVFGRMGIRRKKVTSHV